MCIDNQISYLPKLILILYLLWYVSLLSTVSYTRKSKTHKHMRTYMYAYMRILKEEECKGSSWNTELKNVVEWFVKLLNKSINIY
jgi:hypothetical protein